MIVLVTISAAPDRLCIDEMLGTEAASAPPSTDTPRNSNPAHGEDI